ncbi:branched-chain-amino-acid aminotransferase [Sphaeroforma arctica JP610]|uniref:Branched-chain-amino-acid aminotransferase n=1 Tax=Sphaeroforma arctica JP610 TaxID=667725 RepID=A0A0L0G2L5_9EUKA|nr:branched-chain-amino-acid aminotransferase [Sphaeroforma arctica JP610]KNC82443.1 branched-chain-amino-acid aminotransferase [Sphaeroforma arctica JP610]|eukprot:XP_014156345.1 branched-chain-amino-acid aminotransferase [Sphaeroforma arctica JP610]
MRLHTNIHTPPSLRVEIRFIISAYSYPFFVRHPSHLPGQDGKVRLFRPDMNMRRLARSTQRIALPDFDQDQFLECIKELVKVDSAWIPEEKGYSLYLRPTAIGTQPSLGVGASKNAKMFVIMSPVGPYYKNGFAPVSLLADDRYNRAWPGGVGNYKIGGNYAPGVVPQIEAGEKGYDQLLWLSDEDHKVTEVGTMNFFVFWTNKAGEKELITAPLEGTILPGVTRDSIIDLAKQWGEFKVTEGWFTMKDLIEAQQEGRLIEAFGAGTACIVSPVKNIGYQGKDYAVPLAAGKSGELTLRVNNTISDIQYGDIESEWSVVVE